MNPVGKALWFIESRLRNEISLPEIAAFSGISRYHLLRVFGVTTGHSVMRYVRARRLSEAARHLSRGASDILEVALDAGYGSHEAFTRAFRDPFGLTPETVRAQSHTDSLKLVEAVTAGTSLVVPLGEPRFEKGRALLIAGLGGRYTSRPTRESRSSGSASGHILATCPDRLGEPHTTCAATLMTRAASSTSPASRSPASLTFPAS